MAHRHAPLLHRSGRQRWKSDHVAGGINIRHARPVIFIYRNVSAIVQREPRFFERQSVHRRSPTCREQRCLRLQFFPALHVQRGAARRVFHFHGTLVEPEVHSQFFQAVAQPVRNLRIQKWQQLVAPIHQRHLHPQRHENRAILTPNHAAANHRQRFRNSLHLQKRIGIERVHIIERNFRGTMWFRSCRNQNHFTTQLSRTRSVCYHHRVSVFKRRPPLHVLNLVQLQIFQDAPPLHLHHFPLVVHEVVNSQIFLQRIIDPVESTLPEPGKIQRGFAQSFAWNRSRVDAASARNSRSLDHRHALAEVRRLRASLLSRRSATYDHQVKLFTLRYSSLRISSPRVHSPTTRALAPAHASQPTGFHSSNCSGKKRSADKQNWWPGWESN